jgi:hypothetical protein
VVAAVVALRLEPVAAMAVLAAAVAAQRRRALVALAAALLVTLESPVQPELPGQTEALVVQTRAAVLAQEIPFTQAVQEMAARAS